MLQQGWRLLIAVIIALMALAATVAPHSALALSLYHEPKYAAILVDSSTGEILYARQPDAKRFPASITKVMTLYLTFEALEAGRLKLTDPVVMSRHAANQAPSRLGLRPGQSLPVDAAIRALATKSANDVAVALAEKVGVTEESFAAMMTLKAKKLGMKNTQFVNASGLPDKRQLTTARDIAILSQALIRDFPQYYSYFSQREFTYGGRTLVNHNRLLQKMPGVDGIKTGYTAAAGFTLAASAVRDGRRLIAVVLGGPSTAARDNNMQALLEAGFDVLARRGRGEHTTVAANLAEPEDYAGIGPLSRPVEQGSGEDVQKPTTGRTANEAMLEIELPKTKQSIRLPK